MTVQFIRIVAATRTLNRSLKLFACVQQLFKNHNFLNDLDETNAEKDELQFCNIFLMSSDEDHSEDHSPKIIKLEDTLSEYKAIAKCGVLPEKDHKR
jgi:hypothetical protein